MTCRGPHTINKLHKLMMPPGPWMGPDIQPDKGGLLGYSEWIVSQGALYSTELNCIKLHCIELNYTVGPWQMLGDR